MVQGLGIALSFNDARLYLEIYNVARPMGTTKREISRIAVEGFTSFNTLRTCECMGKQRSFVSVPEFSAFSGLSKLQVAEAISRGQLLTTQDGKRRRLLIDLTHAKDWLRSLASTAKRHVMDKPGQT